MLDRDVGRIWEYLLKLTRREEGVDHVLARRVARIGEAVVVLRQEFGNAQIDLCDFTRLQRRHQSRVQFGCFLVGRGLQVAVVREQFDVVLGLVTLEEVPAPLD